MRKSLFLVLVCIAVPALAQNGGKPKARIPFEKYTLPNGLEVILHEDHRLPMVTTNIWYHVGAANERAGRTGFAHLFEHMMFQGSRHVGDDQHFAILESIGGRGINATTNFDRTNYFETVPKNQLATALWLEADRMGFLTDTLTQAKLDNQRDVVRNERRQRTDNRPYGRADERIYQLLFPKPHPYYGVVIGSHEDLQAATVDDVKGFFKTYYAPNNASLVVAGDFDPAAAKKLVDQYFGSLPKVDEPPPVEAKVETAPDKEIRQQLTDSVQLARVSFAWIAPQIYSEGEADLDLFSMLFGSGKSSRLYKRLVYEKKMAQSVSCSLSGMALGSVFECDVLVKPGVQPADVEKEFDAELAAARGKAPDKEELARAKTRARSAFLHALESASGRANLLNEYNHFVGTPDYYEKDQARYQAVTPKSVLAATQKWLDPAHRVVVTVLPEAK